MCANLGYVVSADGESVYHPGDALAVPEVPITTLLVPMQASWLKTDEAIGFLRWVRPDRAIGIHDGQVNDRARASINHWLATEGDADYHWLAPGTTFGESGGASPGLPAPPGRRGRRLRGCGRRSTATRSASRSSSTSRARPAST